MLWKSVINRVRRLVAPLCVAALAVVAGCGREPQITSRNRPLIVSLATAVSARSTQWLESNARVLEEHRSEGVCSDTEYKTFLGIINQARAGDWKEAENAVYALRDSQEPTAEDLKNLESRKLDPEHDVTRKLRGSGRAIR